MHRYEVAYSIHSGDSNMPSTTDEIEIVALSENEARTVATDMVEASAIFDRTSDSVVIRRVSDLGAFEEEL